MKHSKPSQTQIVSKSNKNKNPDEISTTVSHPFEPVWDTQSRILILGSFPSVLSRKNHFYYGNPQNRFWRVLATLYQCPIPQTVSEKRALLAHTHIALWDVIASCTLHGSSDASIRNAVPNDFTPLLHSAPIHAIFTNGATADTLYRRYLFAQTGILAVRLPSTSPANAAWSLQRLCDAWQIIRESDHTTPPIPTSSPVVPSHNQ